MSAIATTRNTPRTRLLVGLCAALVVGGTLAVVTAAQGGVAWTAVGVGAAAGFLLGVLVGGRYPHLYRKPFCGV